jgi:lipoic acid synthetase
LSQNLNNIDTDFYSIEIPETESVIKEQTEWFKVDLPKKIIKHKKKPDWLRVKLPIGPKYTKLRKLVEDNNLNTICTSGSCPNMGECWGEGTATFMILGNICTRSCKFCGVKTGRPLPVDWNEAEKVANSIKIMNLKHAVLTSVDRDDLKDDMGSKFWVETVKKIRELNPGITIETLIPDFQGINEHIDRLIDVKPEVISHNIETTRRLTKEVRVQAKYDRSLKVLRYMKDRGQRRTKSGIMLGLGETKEEVIETIHDLKDAGVDIVTIGQYLQPSKKHLQVQRFVTPDEFNEYKEIGNQLGFKHFESSALVRSSYRARKHVN